MAEFNEKITNSNECIVCYKNVKYYSIGMCEHPVCFECSTRMRVLCQQNECPICRQDLPKVVFTKEIKPFRFLRKGNLVDTRYNIYFDNPTIQKDFIQLLSHQCSVCPDNQQFSSFNSMQDHMKNKHNLYYCDLCVDNLKIFSFERRCYSKPDLQRHQHKGDVDDKSHKGHPMCVFCEQRYVDNDELFRHLRRDHLFCHFCDADGRHTYYSTYEDVRLHFEQEHFLCQEGECLNEQFTSVFRTEIDLKAHKANVHGKQLGKAAAKQVRTLELEFTHTPRAEFRNRRGFRDDNSSSNHRNGDEARPNHSRNPHIYQRPESPPQPEPTFMQQPLCDVQSTQEFPTLGNTPVHPLTTVAIGSGRNRGNLTIRGVLKNNYKENFPSLGPDLPPSTTATTLTKSFNVSVSSSKSSSSTSGGKSKQTPNLSIHVNHRPDGTVMTRLTSNSQASLRVNSIPSTSRDIDFPSLERVTGLTTRDRAVAQAAAAPPSTVNPSSWTKVTCVKREVAPRKNVLPAALPPPIQSNQDFPSLAKPAKPNKTPAKPTKSPAPAGPSWMQLTDMSNSPLTTIDATKGKAKKKKVKQQQNEKTANSNGNSSSNESSSSTKVNKVVDNSNNSAKSKEVPSNKELNKKSRNKGKQNSGQENFSGNSQENSSQKMNATTNTTTITSASGQRKRSELKIENLNTTNNNKNTAKKAEKKVEDFPALGRATNRPPGLPSPPPGFSAPLMTSPPPGFMNCLNGLMFTNSSGENYTIVCDDLERKQQQISYTYLTPPNFERRNRNLIAEFNDCFGSEDSEEFQNFCYLSRVFRSGLCDADSYYKKCRMQMGDKVFNRLFAELLALLPDIEKQRELFKVHQKEMKTDKISGLVSCQNCGQILQSSDLQDHATSHTLENHFQALGKTGVSSGSWQRK